VTWPPCLLPIPVSQAAFYFGLASMAHPASLRSFSAGLTDQHLIRTAAIIKHNDEIVGYGSLLYISEYPLFEGAPEINDVWIHENHLGVGLGTSLIQWFEVLAKDKGYKEIGIGVGLYADYAVA